MSTKIDSGVPRFDLNRLVDTRLLINLIDSSCDWALVAEKTHFTFCKCTLNTVALSKNLLKPLNGYLSLLEGIERVLSFKRKYWDGADKGKSTVSLESIQHLFNAAAHLSGGICYLIACGVIYLSPHFRILNLTKHIASTADDVLQIALDFFSMWKLYCQDNKNDPSNKWRWCDHIVSVWAQTLSIVFTVSIELAPELGFLVSASKQFSPITLAILSTCKNLGKLAKAAVHNQLPDSSEVAAQVEGENC